MEPNTFNPSTRRLQAIVKALVDGAGDAHKALCSGEETLATQRTALDLLADVERLNAAVDAREATRRSAEQRVGEADTAFASAAADRAMLIDDAESRDAAAKVKKLVTGQRDARDALEQENLILAELNRRLVAAEDALEEQKAKLLSAKFAYDAELAALFRDELQWHLEALVPLLKFFDALGAGGRAYSVSNAIAQMRIPDPSSGVLPLLDGTGLSVDGRPIDIAAERDEDPLLLAAQAAAAHFPDVQRQVDAYVRRAVRLKAIVPYERKGYTLEGRTGEQRDASRAAAARPPWKAPNSQPAHAEGQRPVEFTDGAPRHDYRPHVAGEFS